MDVERPRLAFRAARDQGSKGTAKTNTPSKREDCFLWWKKNVTATLATLSNFDLAPCQMPGFYISVAIFKRNFYSPAKASSASVASYSRQSALADKLFPNSFHSFFACVYVAILCCMT
ncbi:hypothetical protein CDAR_575891 [Caerostris darwini]|uniref:Uncharacterized protein n=1 Tax=Caerostris darwini TaxID=1538125 RepID=A0AAV4X6C9_9ARAC|nr:hypothetical protein CDAR_575891 [Caerostris darwini]